MPVQVLAIVTPRRFNPEAIGGTDVPRFKSGLPLYLFNHGNEAMDQELRQILSMVDPNIAFGGLRYFIDGGPARQHFSPAILA